jgi:hypothetical protein
MENLNKVFTPYNMYTYHIYSLIIYTCSRCANAATVNRGLAVLLPSSFPYTCTQSHPRYHPALHASLRLRVNPYSIRPFLLISKVAGHPFEAAVLKWKQ